MRITPLDVRKQEFRKAVRGYDGDEVRGFLTTLAEEYEAVLIDNKNLRETIGKTEEKLGEYQKMEGNLRDTLMTAQRVMQDTKDNATREGGLIVQEARQQAQQILSECRIRTEELRREIIMLRKEKETYLARFRMLAEAQIQFVDTHESDFRAVDKRMLDMADAVVGGVPAVQPGPGFKPASIPSSTQADAGSEDVWRDYAPVAGAPGVTTTVDESAARVAASLAAAVAMASKGIPVAAVPAGEKGAGEVSATREDHESMAGEGVVPV